MSMPNYVGKINDTFAMDGWRDVLHVSRVRTHRRRIDEYSGSLCRLQRRQLQPSSSGTPTSCLRIDDNSAQYTEANYTQPIGDNFSLAFHVGYAWGDSWDGWRELIDYALQGNWTFNKFTIFAKFTGTDAERH